jgi:hypothetical protein
LKTIFEPLVPSHSETGEEALHSLLERYSVDGEFVAVEIVFEVTRLKTAPVYQSTYPYFWFYKPNEMTQRFDARCVLKIR